MGYEKSIQNFLLENLQGRETNQKIWCRWEDNINMDPTEAEFWGMDCIHLPQNRDHWWPLESKVKNP
jgi:hypothetical protein